MTCNSVRKQLSAYLDGQLTSYEIQEIFQHTQSCKSCANLLEDFQNLQTRLLENIQEQEPSDIIWESLQARIRAEKANTATTTAWLKRVLQTLAWHPAPQVSWMKVAAFATVVAVAIFLGAIYSIRKNTTVGPRVADRVERYESSQSAPIKISTPVSNQASLQGRIAHYLEKSDQVLVDIKNFDQPEDVQTVDLTSEKNVSKRLVDETMYLKRNLDGTRYEYLKPLVNDIEMVLLDISNLDEAKARDEIELLRRGISQKDLITKINFVKLDGDRLSSADNKS